MQLGIGPSVAYGTLLMLIQHICLDPNFFYLIHQLGGTYAIMGRDSQTTLSTINLQVAMLRMGHTQDHIHFELNEVL